MPDSSGSGILGGIGNAIGDFFLTENRDGINWGNLGNLAAGAAGVYGYTQAGQNQAPPVGYQGGIPEYTATRYQLPADPNAPARRPGEAGQRYFTDTTFTKGANPMGYVPPAPPTAPVVASSGGAPAPTVPTSTGQIPPATAATPYGYRYPQVTPGNVAPTGLQGYSAYNPNAGADWNPADRSTWSADELAMAQNWAPPPPASAGAPQQGTGTDWYYNQQGAVDLGDDYLTDIQKLMTEFSANGPSIDGSGQVYSPGEVSTILGLAQQYNVSPEQLAGMAGAGITGDQVAAKLKEWFPHEGYNYLTDYGYAQGGIAAMAPRYLSGPTDGMADQVPTNGSQQSPPLSDGEFVVPADAVSDIGNGNSAAGARELYDMMGRVREARHGTPEQGQRINPREFLPR